MKEIRVRQIKPADYPMLEEFIYHALFIPPGVETPPRDIIYNPGVFIYIDGFGSKHGDCGVIAEVDGKAVGASWTRIIPAYGHIDDETPELATSVLAEYRGQGIGTTLMKRLFELLREHGYKRTSLAVQQKNAAVRFYQRLGYKTVRENDEEFIMVKDLTDMDNEYSMVISTVADKESAKKIAKLLIESRLAACVKMLPIESVYTWQDKFCEEAETMLLIKSRTALFNEIKAAIKENHPYEVPEIIQISITAGLPEYLKWIDDNTRRE